MATTTLFAALDVLEGKVIGRCMQRYRHQEFIRFLNAIKAEIPVGKIIHVVLDNYATHKHPQGEGLAGAASALRLPLHPEIVLLAQRRRDSTLTRRRLKRGVFRSIVELQAATNRFLAETNADPKPFVWTAHPDRVIAAVQRGMQVLEPVHKDRRSARNNQCRWSHLVQLKDRVFGKNRVMLRTAWDKCNRQLSQSLRSSRRA
jgi:hypothetical protein